MYIQSLLFLMSHLAVIKHRSPKLPGHSAGVYGLSRGISLFRRIKNSSGIYVVVVIPRKGLPGCRVVDFREALLGDVERLLNISSGIDVYWSARSRGK